MDAVILDDEIAPALAAAPDRLRALGRRASGHARRARRDVRRRAALRRGRAHRARRERRPARRRPRAPAEGRRRPAAVRVLDPRRRLRRSAPTTWTTPGSTASACASRASACRSSTGSRRRRAYPGPLDDCYAGLRVDARARRRARRSTPDRIGIVGHERRWRAGRGARAARARPRRGAARVPAARVPDDRRPPDHVVEPARRPADLEPRVERRSAGAATSATSTARRRPRVRGRRRAPTDLAGLPPALVIVGGADGFRDEDIDYALRLNQAGVPTELHVLPGAPHGVQMFADSVVARRWNQMVTGWLEQQLAPR